ncbi:MAG: hypothetical protein J5529_03560 [Prevotella sp.]|nr:hypothetical protein [Prevotella sp.]
MPIASGKTYFHYVSTENKKIDLLEISPYFLGHSRKWSAATTVSQNGAYFVASDEEIKKGLCKLALFQKKTLNLQNHHTFRPYGKIFQQRRPQQPGRLLHHRPAEPPRPR